MSDITGIIYVQLETTNAHLVPPVIFYYLQILRYSKSRNSISTSRVSNSRSRHHKSETSSFELADVSIKSRYHYYVLSAKEEYMYMVNCNWPTKFKYNITINIKSRY